MANLKFSKELRLLTPSGFRFVFQNSRQVDSINIIIFSCTNSLEYPRIGLAIAKRNIKHAHDRNRIKRIIRESFRLIQYQLPNMDFVVVARKSVVNLDNRSIFKDLKQLWLRYYHISRGS